MEVAPLFLLLLLPPADTTGDTAAGIQASLRRELGDVAMAIAPDTLVTPAMWQGERAQLHARFIARIEWKSQDKATVELLASPSASPRSKSSQARELVFAAQDGKAERGRAIGLVLAELLRESPASAFTDATHVTSASESTLVSEAGPAPPSRLALGGMFTTEREMSGNWAMGPELTYGFGLGEALCLQASGWALFGSADQYANFGFGLGLRWEFLRARQGAHALGIGLAGDVFRESAGSGSDNSSAASNWNAGLGARLAGRLTVWRTLRLVGEFNMWMVSKAMTLTVGDDANRRTFALSHWRPRFAVGLELAM